jgi:formate hydrogenlyase transcriptional activator
MVMQPNMDEVNDTGADRSSYERVLEGLLKELNMGRSFEELFESLYDQLRGVVPYHRIAVALLEGPRRLLRLISCRSDGPLALKVGYASHLDGSTLEPLLETGQPRIINDLPAYLTGKPQSASTQLIVREGMRSSLTLPLLAEGQPIGVIFFSSRQENAYTLEHERLLERLAAHIAISVEKTRLITELRQKNDELAAANASKEVFLQSLQSEVEKQTEHIRMSQQRYRRLVQLGQIVTSSLDLREVFRVAAEQVHELLQCDRVSLLLVDASGELRHGFAVDFQETAHWRDLPPLPLSGSAVHWVMTRRLPRIARALSAGRQFPEDQRLFVEGYGSYVYLPLVSRDRSLGVMGVASRREEEPDAWDLELLSGLCQQLAIALDNAAAYGEIARLKAELEEQNVYLRDEIKTAHNFGDIVGGGQTMQLVREAVQQVAQTDATVLILGETGTGKELLARAIHDLSPRRDKLLVKVNCAALAPHLITSELFGHEAGAFTGAAGRRIGRFELAQGGTIFLDEIAELPLETQVLLLRVLQEKSLERVGGNEPIAVDARVIAATNRDLRQDVREGHFRDDLFYRLHVFPIRVPPLRERREDIPALLDHFINRFARRLHKDITRVHRRTMELLMNYNWPGNVRELENLIERAVIVSRGDTLEIDATWLAVAKPGGAAATDAAVSGTLAEVERQAILQALQLCGGKVYGPDGAAARLGLKPTTLYGKMRKHKIRRNTQHAAQPLNSYTSRH